MARSVGLLAAGLGFVLVASCGGRSSLPLTRRDGQPAGGGGDTGGGGTGAAAGAGGTGGAGGVVYPPGCVPGLPGPAVLEVPDLKGGSYCIDSTEVTNDDYAAFIASNPSPSGQSAECAWNDSFVPTDDWPPAPGHGNYPVTWVDWCDATRYCAWAGKRLCGRVGGGSLGIDEYDPAINEWTNACTAGGTFDFPYGPNYEEDACNLGNTPDTGGALPEASLPTCEGGFPGLFDMVGQMGEWTSACSGGCRTMGGDLYFLSFDGCYHKLGFDPKVSIWFIGIRCCRDAG